MFKIWIYYYNASLNLLHIAVSGVYKIYNFNIVYDVLWRVYTTNIG